MAQATLHGVIQDDGGGGLCDVRFEYGTTTNYGSATPWQSALAIGVPFEATIYDLGDGAGIHYRAVARNRSGIFFGNDMSFTTLSAPRFANLGDESILLLGDT